MKPQEVAIFASGCFWCMVHPFDQWDGVHEVVSGYTGGHKDKEVCTRTRCLHPKASIIAAKK